MKYGHMKSVLLAIMSSSRSHRFSSIYSLFDDDAPSLDKVDNFSYVHLSKTFSAHSSHDITAIHFFALSEHSLTLVE